MIIQDKKTKEVYNLQWQQYKIGLYIAIYKAGRIFDQFGVNETLEEFLKTIKKQYTIKTEGINI